MIARALPMILGIVAVSFLATAASSLPSLKAERWVNSAPLTSEALRGKVVLVDFWEYIPTLGARPCAVFAWRSTTKT